MPFLLTRGELIALCAKEAAQLGFVQGAHLMLNIKRTTNDSRATDLEPRGSGGESQNRFRLLGLASMLTTLHWSSLISVLWF
jgi:hypothetical protein